MKVGSANKCFYVHCQSCVKFNFHSVKIRNYKATSQIFPWFLFLRGDLTLYIYVTVTAGLHGTSRSVRFPVGVSGHLAGAGWGLCCSCPHLTGSSLPLCLALAMVRLWWAWGLRGVKHVCGDELVQACSISRSMASLLIFNYCGIVGNSLNIWLRLLHLLKVREGLP